MTSTADEFSGTRVAYRSAVAVAIVTGVFSIVVAILMAAAHFQLAARPSLELPVLEQRRGELRERPDDAALKQQIRDLDLMVRRAYFVNLNAMQTGGVLLLIGVLATLASLRFAFVLRRRLPDPRQYGPVTDPWGNAAAGRWSMAGSAAVLVVAAAFLTLLVGRDLRARPVASVRDVTPVKTPAAYVKPQAVVNAPVAKPSPVAASEEEMLKNWPCFRGAGGMGIAHSTNVPLAWDGKSSSNILWKTGVQKSGFSSPIVWGRKLAVSGADKIAREVYCYDSDTGQLLWRKAVTGVPGSPTNLPDVSADTGYAAPTLATDGKHAFAIFATGDVVSFDPEGKQVWGRNLGVPDNNYGHASSLMTHGGLLLVQYDTGDSGRVLALDCATGNTVWDTPRAGVNTSWASPILVNSGKRNELILIAAPRLAGYDPLTGAELWSVECMGGEVGPSPGYAAGRVFVANEYVRLAAVELGVKPKMIWEYGEDLPSVSSPVASDRFVFMAASSGVVTCLDARTGAVLWKHEFTKGFYSSPVWVGDRIYLMDIAGLMHVVAADKEYRLLAESDLGEPSVCTPAFVGNRIYIRGKENLYCVGRK